jgi:hypothetical protein
MKWAGGDVVDGEHIVVANDNNLPYSAGRKPNVQDDDELILLHVPELLRARYDAAGPRRRGDRIERGRFKMKLPRRQFLHLAAASR